MSFVKELIDDVERDLSGAEPRYGEDLYDLGPWPSPYHVLLTDDTGFHSLEIEAFSLADCERKIQEQFPSASYWEIGIDE